MENGVDILDKAICTIVSKTRVHQVLTLYESIVANDISANIFIFCVDEESYYLLIKIEIPKAIIIDFSNPNDSALIQIKNERKLNEYCWTLKPIAILYIFDNYPNINEVIYADGDIYFFSDPIKLINRIKKWSVILTTHKINKKANGGFVCFKRDRTGLDALNWWKEQCIKWCYAYDDNGNFGDQGHLDKLKRLYKNIYYLEYLGVNVAPWNQDLYDIKNQDGTIYVNDCKLIFFHFSGLRMIDKHDYSTCWKYDTNGFIYDHYIDVLRKKIEEIESIEPGFFDIIFDE